MALMSPTHQEWVQQTYNLHIVGIMVIWTPVYNLL